jgi:hypothetical protein
MQTHAGTHARALILAKMSAANLLGHSQRSDKKFQAQHHSQ